MNDANAPKAVSQNPGEYLEDDLDARMTRYLDSKRHEPKDIAPGLWFDNTVYDDEELEDE